MKITNLFLVAVFFSSCTSNQGQFIEDITIVNKLNDKVAFDNRCKLTSTYNDREPNEIDLKIGSSYTDVLFPGKILYDYHQRIESTDLDIREYHLNDMTGKLYSLSKEDLLQITQKNELSKSLLKGFKSNDLTKFYNQLDTTIRHQFTFEDFNKQLLDFDLRDAKFSGFQLVDSILGVGYKSSENQIIFIYKWNSDNKIYGFNVE